MLHAIATGECHQDARATHLLRLHGEMYTVTIAENVHTTHRQPNIYMESQNTTNMWIHRLNVVCSCLHNCIHLIYAHKHTQL